MNLGDWAGNFFTGDWTNAYEESPMLTVGVPALLATAGMGAAGVGPLAGLLGAGEAAGAAGLGAAEAGGLGLGEAAGGGFLESLLSGGGLEGTLGEALLTGGEGAGYAGLLPEGVGEAFASAAPTFESMVGTATGGSDALAAAAEVAGGMGGEAGGGGNFLTGMLTGAKDQLMKNPLGTAAAAVGLGTSFLGGGSDQSAERQKLQSLADQLGPQGEALRSYLTTGTLPPGLQAKLDQATQAAKARIISNHAKNGMSTDPSMNSALAQELNGVDINAVAAMAQAQIQMMQTGLKETGLSTQLYEMLMKMDRQDNKDLMDSIARFAAALGGSSGMKKAA